MVGKRKLESVEEMVGVRVVAWDSGEATTMDQQLREELEAAFRLFDREEDGQIEVQELSNLLWALGLQPTKQEVEALILEMDADKSETVDIEEFLATMARKMKEAKEKDEVKEAFTAMDRDMDGVLGREDLVATLTSLGMVVTEEQVGLVCGEPDVPGGCHDGDDGRWIHRHPARLQGRHRAPGGRGQGQGCRGRPLGL